MGNPIPRKSRARFDTELAEIARRILDEPTFGAHITDALWLHFEELRRWNPRLSLIGPGTAESAVERHYGESLAALPLIGSTDKTLVDIGSGGGFPGFVLAVAKPGLSVTLVEPKQKKCAFLMSALRQIRSQAELSPAAQVSVLGVVTVEVVAARIEDPLPASLELPEAIDLVTCRALALKPPALRALVDHSPGVRFLLWVGEDSRKSLEQDWARVGLRVTRRRPLAGSRGRAIVELSPGDTG